MGGGGGEDVRLDNGLGPRIWRFKVEEVGVFLSLSLSWGGGGRSFGEFRTLLVKVVWDS